MSIFFEALLLSVFLGLFIHGPYLYLQRFNWINSWEILNCLNHVKILAPTKFMSKFIFGDKISQSYVVFSNAIVPMNVRYVV
jgi:hypothetical protein